MKILILSRVQLKKEKESGRTDDDDGDGANWTITFSLGGQNILSQVGFLFLFDALSSL